jgi:hypothetical protein
LPVYENDQFCVGDKLSFFKNLYVMHYNSSAGLPDFLVGNTKTEKMYQIVIKFPKCPQNVPNVHWIHQHF